MEYKKLLFVALLLVSMLFSLTSCGWVTITDDPPAETSGTKQDPPADSSASVDPPALVSVNPLMEAELHTADVMNGFGTEKVGEWGYIEISKSDMTAVTGEQLTEFCQNRYAGSGLNWVGIIFEDGTGLRVGPGWQGSIDYGKIDIETVTFSDAAGTITSETWDAAGTAPVSYQYISYEEMYEIQAAIEEVVPAEYKGTFYSCDVMLGTDDTYSVLLSIVVDVTPPDSTEIISSLEESIYGLGYDNISSIDISAYMETQTGLELVGSN